MYDVDLYYSNIGVIRTFYFDIKNTDNRITHLFVRGFSESKRRSKKDFVVVGIKLDKIYRIEGK
jgi:hypothetical protein